MISSFTSKHGGRPCWRPKGKMADDGPTLRPTVRGPRFWRRGSHWCKVGESKRPKPRKKQHSVQSSAQEPARMTLTTMTILWFSFRPTVWHCRQNGQPFANRSSFPKDHCRPCPSVFWWSSSVVSSERQFQTPKRIRAMLAIRPVFHSAHLRHPWTTASIGDCVSAYWNSLPGRPRHSSRWKLRDQVIKLIDFNWFH